jgi:archaellum component FlaG (FlaF/FlaG flagellin family)
MTSQIKDIVLRIIAVFILGGLSTIGAAAIFGVNVIVAAFVAGVLAVTKVGEELARAFLTDGKLDTKEINEIFTKAEEEDK